jgi:hypothetical protein
MRGQGRGIEMTDQPETERVDWTDCLAGPGRDNTRVSYVKIRMDLGRSLPSTMRKSRSTPSERATSASW